jgi:hypothetical protein
MRALSIREAIMKARACEHLRRIGDNYGVSCQDCGAKLEGYGFVEFGRNLTPKDECVYHIVMKNGDQCIYCHRERDALYVAHPGKIA